MSKDGKGFMICSYSLISFLHYPRKTTLNGFLCHKNTNPCGRPEGDGFGIRRGRCCRCCALRCKGEMRIGATETKRREAFMGNWEYRNTTKVMILFHLSVSMNQGILRGKGDGNDVFRSWWSVIFLLLTVLSLFQKEHKEQLRCCLMPVYHLGSHAILLGSLQGNPRVAWCWGFHLVNKATKWACWLQNLEVISAYLFKMFQLQAFKLINMELKLQTCRLHLIPRIRLPKTAKGNVQWQ